MNNFCFRNLRIVGEMPCKDDYVIGAHSHEIISLSQSYYSLHDAIDDLDRVIIFSRRTGSKKKPDYNPRQIGDYLSKIDESIKIGLVFGRETYGLTDEECELADLRCYIAANPDFPSLNLAQAVAVVLYEIYTQKLGEQDPDISFSKGKNKRKFDPLASKKQITDALDYSIGVLEEIKGFKSEQDQKYFFDYFNSLLVKANSTEQMTIDLKRVFNRVLVAFQGKGKGY